MFVGFQLQSATPPCSACGLAMVDHLERSKVFMKVQCENHACPLFGAQMVVERETMLVLFTDFRIVNGKPAWPSHWVDAKGCQVLPEPGRVTGT